MAVTSTQVTNLYASCYRFHCDHKKCYFIGLRSQYYNTFFTVNYIDIKLVNSLQSRQQGQYLQQFIFFITYEWAQLVYSVTLDLAGMACKRQTL